MNLLSTLFDWLLTASIRASLLVPVVLVLQWLLRRHLGARAHYALWLPVLVVLITPVLPQSQWSMENLLVKEELPPITAPKRPEAGTSATFDAPVASRVVPQGQQASRLDWSSLRVGVWAAMSATLLLIASVSFVRTLRQYRNMSTPLSESRLDEINQAAREVGLSRTPRVWCSTAVTSPAVTGLLRPVLLLPASFEHDFTASEARLIVRHELMHLRRRDLPLNALLCVLMALHWFNPLLWLAFWKVRADREAACDAQVLKDAPPQRRIEYGHALLKAETAFVPLRLSLGFVGLFQRGALLRSRIQSIAIPHQSHPAMKIIAVSTITILTFFGITRAAPPEEKPHILIQAKFIEISSEANQPTSLDMVIAETLENTAAENIADGPVKAVLDDPQFQVAIRRLSQRKRVDLMATPSVTTLPGQKATIKVGREVAFFSPDKKFPGYEVGVTLDVLPALSDTGLLDLRLHPSIVECVGLKTDEEGKEQPVLSSRKANARASLKPGQTVMLDLGTKNDEQRVEEEQADGKMIGRTDHYTRRALVFVTASVIKPKPPKSVAKGWSIGKSAFRKGDRITITNVQRGNGFLTVTADYQLASAEAANLSFYVTSLTSNEPVKTHAKQIVEVTKGSGTVTLHHPDLPEGLPHLSFYDLKTRKAIGGIYFGTETEAKRSMMMNLDYMLADQAVSESKTAAVKQRESDIAKLRAAKSQRYDFSKARLGDVLRYIATDAGLNFIALAEDSPLNGRPVTFSLDGSPFTVLETICHANDLVLVHDKGVWHIRLDEEQALSGRDYPNPMKDRTDVILKDLRRILNLSDNSADEKVSVTFKEADNNFHVTANRMQHSWVEAYLLGLGRGK